jgi:hypothetical protein
VTTSTTDCRRREAIFDFHPVTGATFEVFWADTSLETFGRGGSGWFWWMRGRGFAPTGPARGPFPSSYSAYRHAVNTATCTACSTHGLAKSGPQG